MSTKEKNKLGHTGWLTCIVVLALLLLHILPGMRWRGHALRRVDLLSDVRPPKAQPVAEADTSLPPPPAVRPAFADTCRTGMTCIEDYSDSTLRGMTPFYQALDELVSHRRHVRIAYLGDSFIEADILTADLREMLQRHYGGCGVGFVPVTSAINEFRPTVRHDFKGWESHSATDSIGFNRSLQGLSGQYFFPSDGAYVELRGQDDYASLLDTCRRASVFFRVRSGGRLTLSARINRGEDITRTFLPSDSLQQMVVEGAIGSVRWTVEQADSAIFYGVAMDDNKGGITLDNFSLRGTTGLSLRRIPMGALRQFNALRPYDLIVLQYGLNVAHEEVNNYAYYATGMRPVLDSLKQAFPQAGILVVGVGDRDYKDEEGILRTMPCIKSLLRYQQRLAADNAVAFWNLYEAMGGEASMAKLVEADPPQANLDYTHINFRGGHYIAGLLYDVLVYGKQQYDRRRAYEDGL